MDRWREQTKMDRVISILASAIVDVVEFLRVWDCINPIPRNTTVQIYLAVQNSQSFTILCLEITILNSNVPNTIRRLDHSWTYTLNDIVATSLLWREVATKMHFCSALFMNYVYSIVSGTWYKFIKKTVPYEFSTSTCKEQRLLPLLVILVYLFSK